MGTIRCGSANQRAASPLPPASLCRRSGRQQRAASAASPFPPPPLFRRPRAAVTALTTIQVPFELRPLVPSFSRPTTLRTHKVAAPGQRLLKR